VAERSEAQRYQLLGFIKFSPTYLYDNLYRLMVRLASRKQTLD